MECMYKEHLEGQENNSCSLCEDIARHNNCVSELEKEAKGKPSKVAVILLLHIDQHEEEIERLIDLH